MLGDTPSLHSGIAGGESGLVNRGEQMAYGQAAWMLDAEMQDQRNQGQISLQSDDRVGQAGRVVGLNREQKRSSR